jgi:hypothetical protein
VSDSTFHMMMGFLWFVVIVVNIWLVRANILDAIVETCVR